jgi:conjugal transfer pilus assembly protein TraF
MNDQRNQQNDRILQDLARDNGILFFFRSDCPHCHRFAPVLKLFAETYGFSVIAVSMDGKGIPEYPYPKPDHELASRLNISTVPAIFMVNPDSNAVATVGYGFNNWVKLKEKILFAAQQLTGTVRKENTP